MTVNAYSRIDVAGADALEFLQGQLSNDLRRLDREPRLLAGWCNPKGRVICLLRVTRDGNRFGLALPSELADPVVRRLTMFRFRAKVDFSTTTDVASLLADGDPADFHLPAWQRSNLERGVPEIGTAQSEQYTPHMLNLDRLDALSFDKGCYTGQEVVARTHYRGASKRRTLRYTATAAPAPGDTVLAGDRKAGVVLNVIDRDLLAVVSLAFAESDLSVGEARLSPVPLPYLLE